MLFVDLKKGQADWGTVQIVIVDGKAHFVPVVAVVIFPQWVRRRFL
jgi:hypothetical protein